MKKDEETKIERLEHLIQSKAFHELSADERDLVLKEFESEEQYKSMRELSPVLDKMILAENELQPRSSTLSYLKRNLPTENSIVIWWKWLELKMPTYAAAAITAVACVITWWVTVRPVEEMSVKSVNRVDTVYLVSKADTIFKEKVIYRFVKTTAEANVPAKQKNNIVIEKDQSPVSVSMKDKEELDRLLVSGSK